MIRHRFIVWDTSILLSILAIGGVVLLLLDIGGNPTADLKVDPIELAILGAGLTLCLTWFGWRRIVEQEREIERQTAAEDRARFMAHHDHLTGLPNRRRLKEALDQAIAARSATSRLVNALFLFDLNGFKKINDTYGHPRGDEVLRICATRMAHSLRNGDLLARTGGDEFALVALNISGLEEAKMIAATIFDTLATAIVIGADRHVVGTGIGVSLLSGLARPEDAMRRADLALYRAKTFARPTCIIFDETMEQETRDQDYLDSELAAAVASGAIVPHYQPIVDLTSGAVQAFEALARWHHPTLGDVPPDQFIPLAEKNGLIRDLSEHLLRRACADARSWPKHVGLSFNISPLSLRDPAFGLRIIHIVGEAGLALARLELEITESAIIGDLDQARDSLSALQEAGVRIVLDDFGTGATSLSHLRSFHFDGIKIDRRFVNLMTSENESAAIVQTLIGLSKGLALTIVAEGVEDPAQSAALRQHGCTIGQGFLFSPAIPANETRDFLARRLDTPDRRRHGAVS